MGIGKLCKSGADVLQRLPEVLPAVRGDDHKAAVPGKGVQRFQGKGIGLLDGIGEGVDHRVPRDKHVVDDIFFFQTVGVARSGRKVKLRELPRHKAVALLREGGGLVVGAQSRLHMAHRHAAVKGGERRRRSGGGVAMQQN